MSVIRNGIVLMRMDNQDGGEPNWIETASLFLLFYFILIFHLLADLI